MPGKLWKMALLALLLLACSLGYGVICRRMASGHRLLVPPFRELLRLLLWLLLGLIALAVAAGPVTVLFRPRWITLLVLGFSGLALLIGWGVTTRNLILSTLYVLSSFLASAWTRNDLEHRITFSARPVVQNWRLAALVLLLLPSASFYHGFSEHVRAHGLLPDQQVDEWTGELATDVVEGTPLSSLVALRQEIVNRVQDVLKRRLDAWGARIEPYVPPVAATLLFVLLFTVTWLLWWIPLLILYVVFALLISVGIAEIATETIQVRRLVIA
jgi:hypothetical protein